MQQFYTYVHCRPCGTPFYVGKGSGRRDRSFFKNRNQFYKNVVKKHGVGNISVFTIYCDSEHESFVNEIMTIMLLRLAGFSLANLTEGGEGPSGMNHSDKTKLQMSAAHKGKKFSDAHKRKIGLSNAGKKMPPMTHEHLTALRNGYANYKITPEIRAMLSARAIGNSYALGLKRGPMSDDHKAKVSAAKMGSVPWNKGIKK